MRSTDINRYAITNSVFFFFRGPTTLFSPLTSAAAKIAELTGSSQFRARKKGEVSTEIISGKYQFLLEKKIFFHYKLGSL